jgi:hypothetical protein
MHSDLDLQLFLAVIGAYPGNYSGQPYFSPLLFSDERLSIFF